MTEMTFTDQQNFWVGANSAEETNFYNFKELGHRETLKYETPREPRFTLNLSFDDRHTYITARRYSIIDYLSDSAGFFIALISLIGPLATALSKFTSNTRIISLLYKVRRKTKHGSSEIKQVKLNTIQRIKLMTSVCMPCFCDSKNARKNSEQLQTETDSEDLRLSTEAVGLNLSINSQEFEV